MGYIQLILLKNFKVLQKYMVNVKFFKSIDVFNKIFYKL